MAPSNPVRIVGSDGRPITANNPLPVTGGTGGGNGGGGTQDVAVTNTPLDVNVSEPLDVQVTGITGPGAFVYGHVAVATPDTAVPLVGSETLIQSGVTVKAHADNTGVIYLGDSAVDNTNGFILAAGEAVFVEFVGDLADIFIDADEADDGVSFIAS